MAKVLKHKLVNLFLQLYTRRRDFSHSITAFKQLKALDFRNIVIYSTTALGDFLMNTPAIHEVRKRFPDAKITIVCSSKMFDYVCTGIGKDWDQVICWNNKVKTVTKLVSDIKMQGIPDLVLILHSHNPYDYMSAIMTGTPFVFRSNYPDNPLIERWLTNYLSGFRGHTIQARLNLIAPLGCEFTEHSNEMHVPCNVENTISDCLCVGFQMGASSSERCWPVQSFVQVAQALFSYNENLKIILLGAPNEIYLSEQFFSLLPPEFHSRVQSLIGKTSMTELTQTVNNLNVLITSDTGTMHIAIALKIPTVSLFVTAGADATGPYQDPKLHQVITGFICPLLKLDDAPEMSVIKPEPVISAAIKVLDKCVCGE